jgi:hypothetical protein
MRLLRFPSLACVLLTGACSAPTVSDPVGTLSPAIIEGLPSTAEEDFVVFLLVPGLVTCTGTLIAPNAVLTALHCVNDHDQELPFRCNSDGTIEPIVPGGGIFGPVVAPERIEVRVGPSPLGDPPSAYGRIVFSTGSDNICHGDIAVIVLDRELDLAPQHVRFDKPMIRGDYQTVIGYGQTHSASVGIRNRLARQRVTAVGEYGEYNAQGVAAPDTFLLGRGVCHGDSGGPSFDEETRAVTGVFSVLGHDDCDMATANAFTQVAPFEDMIREALVYAGHEPLIEQNGSGDGGEGGTGSTEPGASGASTGGAGGTGGSPGTAGKGGSDVGMAGSDTGEGGEGSSTGATGATGSGAESGSNGQAGSKPAQAGTGASPSEGSGSRGDGCACRLEGSASHSKAGWGGFLSLLAVALLRRRAR